MFISTIHNIDPWRKWYHVLLDRATASRTDLFIAVSEAVRRTRLEREKFPPDKIITIHNGIDVEYFELLPEKKNALEFFGLSADEPHPVVGVLANLRKQKGHFEIIEALPSICEKLPEIKIIFAGKDFSEGEVQRRAREKGVQDRIVFAGFVKDSRQLLAASDILLLPSHWEGFPVSVLEAMAAGVPVIATPVGGVPEMIKNNETGILIPPGSPRAIEDAVVSLVEDPQKAEGLSKRAREVVRKRFDINTMVEKYQDIYIELLAKLNNSYPFKSSSEVFPNVKTKNGEN